MFRYLVWRSSVEPDRYSTYCKCESQRFLIRKDSQPIVFLRTFENSLYLAHMCPASVTPRRVPANGVIQLKCAVSCSPQFVCDNREPFCGQRRVDIPRQEFVDVHRKRLYQRTRHWCIKIY